MVKKLNLVAAAAMLLLACLAGANDATSQSLDRVPFNGQQIWVNGSNVAWIDFARDVGPGSTNLPIFREMFRELNEAGGNSMRFWLHTTGATTPAFSGDIVVGPGEGTIEDLIAVLDAAWEQEIGLMLTLWGHDMLRTDINPDWTARNRRLLTDPLALDAYISEALIPMVEGVGAHPALLAWEVFNEPEGISIEHGWSDRVKVPMADIQRVTNRIAGAIHRAQPQVKVTTGAHGMYANSDITLGKSLESMPPGATSDIPPGLRERMELKYGPLTETQLQERLSAGHRVSSYNYYRDDRLVAVGGDPDGTLDFYTTHYYDWAQTAGSPFHKDFSEWQLDKPMVIAEFFMVDTFGVEWENLYEILYQRGYAGAMSWQWYDTWARGNESWPRTLANTRTMATLAPSAVEVITPGPKIQFFSSDRKEIQAGDSVTLSWHVERAESVWLNQVPEAAEGQRTLTPTETTSYVLEALGDGITRSSMLQVSVLAASEINRALDREATASSGETGVNADPSLAVDGDTASRWSSAYADNQWLQVDLGESIDVERVQLRWEVAFGKEYDIQLSFDGINWKTVHEERDGDGGMDTINFPEPQPGRFVRLVGLRRGTLWGFSLWEMAVYGLVSSYQPPAVRIATPNDGASFEAGELVPILVEALDEDGDIDGVDIVVNGSTVATLTSEPYEMSWVSPEDGGEFELHAVARDATGLSAQSASVSFVVMGTALITRYEVENLELGGTFELRSDGGFSATPYVSFGGTGSITLPSVVALQAGSHQMGVRFRLSDQPVSGQLRINGLPSGVVPFESGTGTWSIVSRPILLRQGSNRIDLVPPGGVELDYVDIAPPGLSVATERSPETPHLAEMELFPNPASHHVSLRFGVTMQESATITLMDSRGKRLAVLYRGFLQGAMSAQFLSLPDLASGVYFILIQSQERSEYKKLVVIQ